MKIRRSVMKTKLVLKATLAEPLTPLPNTILKLHCNNKYQHNPHSRAYRGKAEQRSMVNRGGGGSCHYLTTSNRLFARTRAFVKLWKPLKKIIWFPFPSPPD